MSRFTPEEMRRAIVALDTIESEGDCDEWAIIVRQAGDSAPNGSRWGNATPNQRGGGSLLAARLANLLGEDRDQCEQAAAEVFAPQRHRAVFDALISYSEELTGRTSHRESAPAAKPIQRPAVRIVADRGVTA